MNAEFWRGRRVFITGHTGFKGGWLTLWLRHMGAEVSGYSLPPTTTPCLFEQARIGEGMHTTLGDLGDLEGLVAALQRAAPETVFHLAAQSLVRRSYKDPVGTYAANVMGTVHLLEAVRRCPAVRSVVVVTSDKCYENEEQARPFGESEPLGGHDPYSSSKACAELLVSAYRRSFFHEGGGGGVAVATARAGNVIGGGDWAEDRLVPDFMRAAIHGEELLIRSPAAVRPWQHVLEPVSGYILLAERLAAEGVAFAESWNFGPGDEDARSVGWLVQQLATCWGEAARWRLDGAPQPHEARYLRLDASKARERLRWLPRWPLEQALRRVVDWHRADLAGVDMRQFSLEQIESYEQAGV